MGKIKIINKYLLIAVVTLGSLLIGLSYSHFTATISNKETSTTISGVGGTMNIDYDGGSAINATGFFPSPEPFATKTFTVTANNSTDETMEYHILLIMTYNTFRDNALQYTLESENTSSNGIVAPSTQELTPIETGESDIHLGNGSFTGQIQDKVHTYTLKMYLPEIDGFDHSVDQSQSFGAYIDINDGIFKGYLLSRLILNPYGGINNIEEAVPSTFSSINDAQENRLLKAEDDYGTSYYFRGAKNHLNNNLIFAEHQWKIVRINGDGSIRIIYNGECPGNECIINSEGQVTQMGTTRFNSSYNDNKYVWYMYGYTSGTYEEAHKNEVNSTIKTYLDYWYKTNILGTPNESYISDTLFCGDRQLHLGTGIGTTETFYKAENRLRDNKNPSLKCPQQDDAFTVNDTVFGNGALDYPIGLLTADEAAMAGLLVATGNSTNYLYTNQNFWLLSPSRFASHAYDFYVNNAGHINYYSVNFTYGARGVLNLKSDTTATGTGTTSDPYVVN